MTKQALRLIFGLGALGLGFNTSSCDRLGTGARDPAGQKEHPLLGAPAPVFELPEAVSKVPVFSNHAGQVVIVDFWATWCKPCRDSFRAYQRLIDKYRGKLVVIGVSVDEDPSGIADFVKETRARFAVVWDENQTLAQSYSPPTMPTSFIVDKVGIVRALHSGFRSGDEREIEAKVGALLP